VIPGGTARCDVAVVGAGPAGTSAALALADAGHRVALLDKSTFPRDKTCGDGLTTLALRELERLGFHPEDVTTWNPVGGAVLHAPDGHVVELPLPTGAGLFAAVARRIDLDAALVGLAERRGVEVFQGEGLRTARQDRAGVELSTDRDRTIRADWVVGADGMWSPLRKALRVDEGRYRGEWHGFRQYLHPTGRRSDELHVWFEADLLPGYAWSFPLPDRRANVGFGVLRGHRLDGKAMAERWRQLLARPALVEVLGDRPDVDGPHRAWPIPARVTSTTLAAGRALFAGDAARATDLFTGEGIGQALLTGRLAAESIDAAIRDEHGIDQAGASYHHAVLAELGPDHRMAWTLSKLMSTAPVANSAIRIVGMNGWTRRNTARWLFEDSPRGIALTPRRWRRGALSGPPAFAAPRQQGA
jgi:menaquinone-9 beta-reductase